MTVPSSLSKLVEQVCVGETRAVARALRLVDDRSAGYRELLKALHGRAQGAWIIGLTGTPGSGKSTLCDQLVAAQREKGTRVAVLAVDPSSPFSGGAILGDRIRMQRHFLDDGVFIRSLATRGQLGGLSASTLDAVVVLDAAGFGTVLVETVGVGQDELEVAKLAHTTCVVSAPGLGDDVQAIKAGILEVADVLVLNKADRPGADSAARYLEMMVALGGEAALAGADVVGHHGAAAWPGAMPTEQTQPDDGDRWLPPVLKTNALKNEGVDALMDAVEAHRAYVEGSEEVRRGRARQRLCAIVQDAVWMKLEPKLDGAVSAAMDAFLAESEDPYSLAEQIVDDALRKSLMPEDVS